MTYPGGKGRLWRDIVSLMPPHDVYIETHLGGGAVLRAKEPATKSFGIDIDPEAIANAEKWDVPSLTLLQGDATDFVTSYPFSGRELIYADPPYVLSTRNNRKYYKYEYTDADHIRLLEALIRVKCPVMISGYSCTLYDESLKGWNRARLTNVTQNGLRHEYLWANFQFSQSCMTTLTLGEVFGRESVFAGRQIVGRQNCRPCRSWNSTQLS